MHLYHYAKELYPLLTTRLSRADSVLFSQEIVKAKQDAQLHANPGSYFESISFFFDPIPLAMIGNHFNNDHHTWFNGNKLYEYVVSTEALERNILYNIVETPADLTAMSRIDWTDPKTDTAEYMRVYMQQKNARKLKTGEQGRGTISLVRHAVKFVGGTEKAYLANNKLSKEDKEAIKGKYAANVPHVMLYPFKGQIAYLKATPVVVGASNNASDRILEILLEVKAKYSELTKHNGVMSCGYGSELLHNKLSKAGIASKLITGNTWLNTDQANKAKQAMVKTIMSIPEGELDEAYVNLKKGYLKRGKLLSDSGHVAVLVGSTIYDITSYQFGLPSVYPLKSFTSVWKNVLIGQVAKESYHSNNLMMLPSW